MLFLSSTLHPSKIIRCVKNLQVAGVRKHVLMVQETANEGICMRSYISAVPECFLNNICFGLSCLLIKMKLPRPCPELLNRDIWEQSSGTDCPTISYLSASITKNPREYLTNGDSALKQTQDIFWGEGVREFLITETELNKNKDQTKKILGLFQLTSPKS